MPNNGKRATAHRELQNDVRVLSLLAPDNSAVDGASAHPLPRVAAVLLSTYGTRAGPVRNKEHRIRDVRQASISSNAVKGAQY